MAGLRIAWRGFGIVFITALNVWQVSHDHYGGALFGGFLISWLWWKNARTSGRSDDVRHAEVWYGVGAALGTVAGMTSAAWWYAR